MHRKNIRWHEIVHTISLHRMLEITHATMLQDFLGGHISGAVNVSSDKFADDDDVANTIAEHLDGKGVETVIVHCALSQVRGPFCADRSADAWRMAFACYELRFVRLKSLPICNGSTAPQSPCRRLSSRLAALETPGAPKVKVLAQVWTVQLLSHA
jgi:hypothetical protein